MVAHKDSVLPLGKRYTLCDAESPCLIRKAGAGARLKAFEMADAIGVDCKGMVP